MWAISPKLHLQGGIQCDLIYICENLPRLRNPEREVRSAVVVQVGAESVVRRDPEARFLRIHIRADG